MRRERDCRIRARMGELRSACDKEIQIQQRRIEASVLSFRQSLRSIKSMAHETVLNQEKAGKLKAQLRVAEDDLVKALSDKTRKEAKKMAIAESISATKTKVGELKRIVADQRTRKDEYAVLILDKLKVMKEIEQKHKQDVERTEEIEEAVSWYNRVLGFRIGKGHGIKFVFTNINLKNPDEEHSFAIRLESDNYVLLDCHPQLSEGKKLIQELNYNNALYSFVRTMRRKFHEAASWGNMPGIALHTQEVSVISVSAPVSSASTDSRSKTPVKKNHSAENKKVARKDRQIRGGQSSIMSPGSALLLRRSPRFKK